MLVAFTQEVDLPLTGEETPVMLVAAVVGYFLIPWLTSALVKWDAPEEQRAMLAIVFGVVGAVALEFAAGEPTTQTLMSTTFTVLAGQQVGYKQFHKPLAKGGKPTVGAVAPGFGAGKTTAAEEQD